MKIGWLETLIFIGLGGGFALLSEQWMINAFVIFALQVINYRTYKIQRKLKENG